MVISRESVRGLKGGVAVTWEWNILDVWLDIIFGSGELDVCVDTWVENGRLDELLDRELARSDNTP